MANLFQKIKQWFPEWKKEAPFALPLGTSSTDGGGLQNIVIKEIQQGAISPNVTYRFIDLTDAPNSYAGQTGKFPKVNAGETGLEFGTAGGGGSVGGLYGINVLNMVGNVTLTPNVDKIYQHLNPNGASRTITLATVGTTAGDRFIIKNTNPYTSSTRSLTVKQASTTLDVMYPDTIKNFIFNGTNWVGENIGTGTDQYYGGISIGNTTSARCGGAGYSGGVAIGYNALATSAFTAGVAIGYFASASGGGDNIAVGNQSKAYTQSVALGDAADASYSSVASQAIAIGNTATARSQYAIAMGYLAIAQGVGGIAIGKSTNNQAAYGVSIGFSVANSASTYGVAIGNVANNTGICSVALGASAKTLRACEISKAIDDGSTASSGVNVSIAGWKKQTTNDTPVEMFLGGISNSRFTIQVSSVLLFTLLITARDNVANEVAGYQIQGLIKRDAANNTILSWSATTVLYEDDAAWTVTATADDTNESLKLTVTGDTANPTNWVARLDGVETRF
jgi:hypothetical protein